MARPTKLTPRVQKTVCAGIAVGLTFKLASERAGITDRSRIGWEKRGREEMERIANGGRARKEEEPFLSFFQSVTRARAKSAYVLTAVIRAAAPTEWRAAAWLLERRFPEDYGYRRRATGDSGGPVTIRVVYEDDDEEQPSTSE